MTLYKKTQEVKEKFLEFEFFGIEIDNLETRKKLQFVKARKRGIVNTFKQEYSTEDLRDQPKIKAIREIFEAMGVNPEENLTAVENLGKLLIEKDALPAINSVVDSCNLASLETLMPIGVFDADQIKGDIILRLSKEGEKYEPIGKETETLDEGILVLADDDGIIARPLFKDSKRTMITEDTRNILVFTAVNAPIEEKDVLEALEIAAQIITTSSGGEKRGDIIKFE